MRVKDVGEFGLIERIRRRVEKAQGRRKSDWIVGIGDDAAVLRPAARRDWVVSTDALVEGVHFRWPTERARTLGRRALAAALSDLAAMGATPLGVVLALEAPPSLELARIDGIVDGLIAAGRRWGCPLVGGNVTRHARTGLTLTVCGEARRGRLLRRDAARPGDRLCVTGSLGRMALAVARARRRREPITHVPTPRLREGQLLAQTPGIGACIDVSDGLLADLSHLLEASRVSAALESERVPLPRGFEAECKRLRVDPRRLALEGGEDYELLFTVRPSGGRRATLAQKLGVRVSEIGRIAPPPTSAAARRPPRRLGGGGWRHF